MGKAVNTLLYLIFLAGLAIILLEILTYFAWFISWGNSDPHASATVVIFGTVVLVIGVALNYITGLDYLYRHFGALATGTIVGVPWLMSVIYVWHRQNYGSISNA